MGTSRWLSRLKEDCGSKDRKNVRTIGSNDDKKQFLDTAAAACVNSQNWDGMCKTCASPNQIKCPHRGDEAHNPTPVLKPPTTGASGRRNSFL